jgi:DNA-directed RNA polymerase subunit RPC12/RpoP
MSVAELKYRGECVECLAKVEYKDLMVGEVITCPECGSDLEIVELIKDSENVYRIRFRKVQLQGEDWGE